MANAKVNKRNLFCSFERAFLALFFLLPAPAFVFFSPIRIQIRFRSAFAFYIFFLTLFWLFGFALFWINNLYRFFISARGAHQLIYRISIHTSPQPSCSYICRYTYPWSGLIRLDISFFRLFSFYFVSSWFWLKNYLQFMKRVRWAQQQGSQRRRK